MSRRMAPFLLAVAIVLVPVVFASCTQDGIEGEDATGPGFALEDDVRGVRVTRSPADGEVGATASVCWEVSGTGDARHMDVHVDEAPHVAVDPIPHEGATFWPENETKARPQGYPMPGSYCTDIRAEQPGRYFVQVHVAPEPGVEGIITRGHHWNVTAGANGPDRP